MGTKLQWISFDLPFRLCPSSFPFPFDWNSSGKVLYPRCGGNSIPFHQKSWIWVGPSLMTFTAFLFAIQLILLKQQEPEEQDGFKYLINVLISMLHVIALGTILPFATYYTLNRKLMAALFSDTYKSKTHTADELDGWYLLSNKPMHRDYLGIALFLVQLIFGLLTISFPVLGIVFNFDPLAPFLPSNKVGVLSSFKDIILFVSCIVLRFVCYGFETAIMFKWFSFVLIQLALVLTIGNQELVFMRKYVENPPPPFRNNRKNMKDWQNLLVKVVILQRKIVLHTEFWSNYIGHLIFIIYSLGIMIWCMANYVVIVLRRVLQIEMSYLLISVSTVCLIMFVVLLSFVSSIAINSRKLNSTIAVRLRRYQLGRRYTATLCCAKISTPFFSFTGNNFFFLLGIPLEITMNLLLTFPVRP
ncbi:unnamed protein product [Orchesella dallaii]|uniref:Gustatory receptor n=1 Tax=Orchesella dallaii TaxID=48710 RepID=A0ABP1QDV8_9HEXA